MSLVSRVHEILLCAVLAVCFAQVSLTVQSDRINLSTLGQIEEDCGTVPCKDSERLSAVKALFEKMGAEASDISIEKYGHVENLIILKQGSSSEKIVIGAHYDKVSDGCGAIDNWTGVVALAHLYRTFKEISLKKTILFVAFGKEEKGLFGSKAMVSSIPKEQIGQYCAMINLDSFGLAAPQVLDNVSSEKLRNAAARLAKDMKIPFASASVEGADSDSSPFKSKKIPSLTLHGLSNDFASIIHTSNDKQSKVNPESVYLGYRLALALAVHVDRVSCNDYR